jgi:hypothetical protein
MNVKFMQKIKGNFMAFCSQTSLHGWQYISGTPENEGFWAGRTFPYVIELLYLSKIVRVTPFTLRFQTYFLVWNSLHCYGVGRHLLVQQHHRLHELHRGNNRGYNDCSSIRGILPFCSGLQY